MWENILLTIQGVITGSWNLIIENPVFGLIVIFVLVLIVIFFLSITQSWASTFLKGAVMVVILLVVIMLIFILNNEFNAAEGISNWIADLIPATKDVISEGANRTNLFT